MQTTAAIRYEASNVCKAAYKDYCDMFRALTHFLANQLFGRFEQEEFYHV
jgi:hypothetical protein